MLKDHSLDWEDYTPPWCVLVTKLSDRNCDYWRNENSIEHHYILDIHQNITLNQFFQSGYIASWHSTMLDIQTSIWGKAFRYRYPSWHFAKLGQHQNLNMQQVLQSRLYPSWHSTKCDIRTSIRRNSFDPGMLLDMLEKAWQSEPQPEAIFLSRYASWHFEKLHLNLKKFFLI